MSKETRSKNSEKTESALSSFIWLIVVVVVLVVGVAGWRLLRCRQSACDQGEVQEMVAGPVTVIDLVPNKGAYFKPEYATTDKQRVKGLSGRTSWAKNQVMIFQFDNDSRQGIWMKDMKFAIDIVWTDSDKKIVWIEKNVSPDTYPTVFQPNDPARYVLELAAGRADELGLVNGLQLKF